MTLASLLSDFLLFSDLCGLQDVQPHSTEVIIHSFFYAALSCGEAFTHERARLFRVTALAGCEFKQSMFLTPYSNFRFFSREKGEIHIPFHSFFRPLYQRVRGREERKPRWAKLVEQSSGSHLCGVCLLLCDCTRDKKRKWEASDSFPLPTRFRAHFDSHFPLFPSSFPPLFQT